MGTETKKRTIAVVICVLIFWFSDFILHFTGVGETNFYYISKFGNAVLFSIIWFFVFNKNSHWKRLIYAVIFGTYISFYYLISSYSGLIQYFGITARYSPPAFMIFGKFFSPVWWWFIHIFAFYISLELASLFSKGKK